MTFRFSKISGFHDTDCEESRLFGCDAMWLLQELKCRRNMSLPSSGEKTQGPKNKVSSEEYLKHDEKETAHDGGDTFLRGLGSYNGHIASDPRKRHSSA
jgi:hypothetical protein